MTQGQRMLKEEKEKKKNLSTKIKTKTVSHAQKKVPTKRVFESFLSPVPLEIPQEDNKTKDSEYRSHKRLRSSSLSRSESTSADGVNPPVTVKPQSEKDQQRTASVKNALVCGADEDRTTLSTVSLDNLEVNEEDELLRSTIVKDREDSLCDPITSSSPFIVTGRPSNFTRENNEEDVEVRDINAGVSIGSPSEEQEQIWVESAGSPSFNAGNSTDHTQPLCVSCPETPPLRAVVSPGSQSNSFRSLCKVSPTPAPLHVGTQEGVVNSSHDMDRVFSPLPPSAATDDTFENAEHSVVTLGMEGACGEEDDDEWIDCRSAAQRGKSHLVMSHIEQEEGAVLTTQCGLVRQDEGEGVASSSIDITNHTPAIQHNDAALHSSSWADVELHVKNSANEPRELMALSDPSTPLTNVGGPIRVDQLTDEEDEEEGLEQQQYLDDLDALNAVRIDYSGFRNPGNDCYACSVVSLLIRNNVFTSALSKSFPEAVVRKMKLEMKMLRSISKNIWKKQTYLSTAEMGSIRDWDRNFPVHSALGFLLNTLRQRKYVLSQAAKNPQDVNKVMECERLLEEVLEMDPCDPHGNVVQYLSDIVLTRAFKEFQRGISLSPLNNALPKGHIFFSGYQEDAHEFLIYLLDCLEKEIMPLSSGAQEQGSIAESSNTGGSEPGTAIAEDENNFHSSTAEMANSVSRSTTKSVWINETTQGRLLNIVRCRNANCRHEIVTVETFVNLGISLPTEKQSKPYATEKDVHSNSTLSSSSLDLNAVSVQSLLQRTLEYERLGEYRCDHCGSSMEQYQGGSFFGVPPPLLFLQIKRFDAHYDAEKKTIVMSKNRSPVDLNEILHVMALPDTEDETGELYYDVEKKQFSNIIHEAENSAMKNVVGSSRNSEREASGVLSLKEESQEDGNSDTNKNHSNNTKDDYREINALEVSYRLQGVVEHHGLSIEHGHYTCAYATHAVKHDELDDTNQTGHEPCTTSFNHSTPKISWHRADDRLVTKLNDIATDRLLHSSAECYLLLYERVEVKHVKCSVDNVMPRMPSL